MSKRGETLEQLKTERDLLRQQIEALSAKDAELQKLQATLHSREREITALLGVTPHPVIARYDRRLRHLYVNSAVRLATGLAPEAYIGKTNREMKMSDEIADIFEGALKKVFKTAAEETIEYSFTLPSGTWFFQSRIVPELNTAGKVETVLAVTRNVTQQRQAEDAIHENVEVLETVHRLGQMLSGELELQKLVQVVTDAATELTRAEFGAFFYNVTDEIGELYTLYTLSGVPREAFSRFPMPRNTHLFGPTFRGEGTVRIDDVHKDPRYGKNDPYFGMPKGHLPVNSYLAVPVISRSREVLGGLFFGHSKPGIFTERDERIIEGLAGQAAIAMDNAHLFQEAQSQQERLQITLSSIGDAVIATDPEGRVTFMNAVAQELTGWNDRDASGKPLEEIFRIVNEYTRDPVENPVSKVIREGGVVGLANHTILLSKNGSEVPIDDSGAPIFDEAHRLVGVILVFRDITERRESELRINLMLELSRAFSQALTSQQIAEIMVTQALKGLGAQVGTVCLLVEQGTMLEILNLHGLSQEIVEKYRRTPLDFPGPLNDAVRSGELVWISSADEYYERYPQFEEIVRKNKSQAIVCIPLKINEKIIGGFNLSFPIEKPRTVAEEGFFWALAQQCAQSLERARLYEAEQKALTLAVEAQQNIAFLAEASAILVMSLDIEASLNQIMSLVVPKIADWTHIDLVRKDGTVQRLVARHIEPEKEAALYELSRKFPVNLQGNLGAGKVIRTSTAEVMSVLPKDWLDNYSQNPEHLEHVQSFNIQSYISVPLVTQGKAFGAMTFGSSTPGYFTNADLILFEEFARRTAQAIANANLYQSEHQARMEADQNLQQVNRLQAATAALSEALTLEQVSKVIIDHTTDAMKASSGLFARLIENNTVLEVLEAKGYDAEAFKPLTHIPLRKTAQIAQSIKTRLPLWLEKAEPLFPRLEKTKAPADETTVILPLGSQQVLGVLILTLPAAMGSDPVQRAFLIALSQQCVQALERAQVYEQAKDAAALEERQRLARDLHDSVSQTMFSASIMAESLPKVWEKDQSKGAEQVQQVITLNRAAMSEMRMLLLELRPEALLNTNLPTLLGHLVAAARGRIEIQADLEINGSPEGLPSNVHVALYRITQESINNIIKHSQASSFRVRVDREADHIEIRIKDNGRGFDTQSQTQGLGLNSIRERAQAIGATVEMTSAPDQGTEITIRWNG